MISENVDEEIPLVITKTFEIQSCVRGLHFFKALGNLNLEKFWMPEKKTKHILSYMKGM